MGLREIERRTERLIADMAECDRLDQAAGDLVTPRLSISVWISRRMKDACDAALRQEPRP